MVSRNLRRQTLYLSLIILVIICNSEFSTAEEYNVPEAYGYNETDTVDEVWHNRYNVQMMVGARLNYEFTVVGSGTIEVYLIKSEDYSIIDGFTYYDYYSQDSPVSAFSNSFIPGEEDGESFTIIVVSGWGGNVTYNANIFIDEVSPNERVRNIAIAALVVLGLVTFVVIKFKLYRKITELITPPPKPPKRAAAAGKPVERVKKCCPVCGAQNNSSNSFCNKCGGRFS